jgi:uncharacterized protein (TIGR02300 family)
MAFDSGAPEWQGTRPNSNPLPKVSSVANPELGAKQVCPNCQAKFYDLGRRPAHCPKCAHEFDPEEALKLRSRRGRPGGYPADDAETEEVVVKKPVSDDDDEDDTVATPEIDQEGHEPIVTPDDDDDTAADASEEAGMNTTDGDDDDVLDDDDDDDSVPFIEDEDDDAFDGAVAKPVKDED